jgi:uncharacterized protein (DUF58 family)
VDLADEAENLERAFPPHPIDPARAFAEWGGTYVDAEVFRAGVRGKRWTELEASFLERCHDAVVFLGPSSIAEYLPAFVLALVRRDPALSALPSFLLSVLTRGGDSERFDARFAELTSAQRRAIARTLAAFEVELAGSPRQADVSAALDDYWRAQIGGVG